MYKAIEEKTLLYTADELVNKALSYSAKSARSKWRGGGVPIVMKVNTPPMTLESKQFAIRKIFQEVEDETLGKFVINTNFVKMSESPPRVKWVSCDIGKDNEYIRKKYPKRSEKNRIYPSIDVDTGVFRCMRSAAFGEVRNRGPQ